MTAPAPAITTSPTRRRASLGAMWGGLALTIAVTVYAFIDDGTTRLLARHIQASYPSYGVGEIETAVALYLGILVTVGGLGVLTWAAVIWATARGKRWAPWAATLVLVAATCIALFGLTVRDTSGDVGLVPLLAWLQVLPCVLGLVAVVQLWRQRR
jgi:hypothetical protein